MPRACPSAVLALLLLTACADNPQDGIARAAARQAAAIRVIGPNDLQLVSNDQSIAIEVIGDTVHVMTPNSKVSVPATYLEHVKYAAGQLSFDIRGVGAQMFDVGNGATGAAFRPEEALAFVAVVLERQNGLERKR